jgi:SAM-dependent methyltransferase
MPTTNAEQIAEWNGVQGQRWATLQREIDGIVAPFGEAALRLAAPQVGERVVDVGCGCGDTSIELARAVGETGEVLGVDVSRPMLEVARAHAGLAGWAKLAFREADASEAALPAGVDLLFSRFGVMFFGQPVPAFRHLRASLRSHGRFVFVCWRAPRDNGWAMTPLAAARQAMNITPVPVDPNAPGPFAFADDERLRVILADAGFEKADIQRFDAPIHLGATPRTAAENAARIGPASRFVRDVGIENLPVIVDAIESALQPLAAPDGRVSLLGSTWLVAASNP